MNTQTITKKSSHIRPHNKQLQRKDARRLIRVPSDIRKTSPRVTPLNQILERNLRSYQYKSDGDKKIFLDTLIGNLDSIKKFTSRGINIRFPHSYRSNLPKDWVDDLESNAPRKLSIFKILFEKGILDSSFKYFDLVVSQAVDNIDDHPYGVTNKYEAKVLLKFLIEHSLINKGKHLTYLLNKVHSLLKSGDILSLSSVLSITILLNSKDYLNDSQKIALVEAIQPLTNSEYSNISTLALRAIRGFIISYSIDSPINKP